MQGEVENHHHLSSRTHPLSSKHLMREGEVCVFGGYTYLAAFNVQEREHRHSGATEDEDGTEDDRSYRSGDPVCVCRVQGRSEGEDKGAAETCTTVNREGKEQEEEEQGRDQDSKRQIEERERDRLRVGVR